MEPKITNVINKTIPFKGRGIHVRYDNDGAVEWVCLRDICRELKRDEKNDIENLAGVCKNKEKYPIYTNGALFWFIGIAEIYTVLNKVKKENKLVAKTCNELLKWTGRLPVGRKGEFMDKQQKATLKMPPPRKPTENISPVEQEAVPETNDEPEQPQYPVPCERHVLYFEQNGKSYHNATLMGKEFGINPREWLLKAETARFRKALVEQGVSANLDEQIITKRGQYGVTFLEYHLAVEFARFLDPNIAVKNNMIMDKLGKYGIVIKERKEEKNYDTLSPEDKLNHVITNSEFKLPQTRSEAYLLLAELARKIEEDKPKVEYYDRMIEGRENFTTYFIASELDVSVVNLYKFLVQERIVKFEKKVYVVYPSYQALQCDKDYLFTFKNGKTYICGKGKRWTHAGREFIIDLFKTRQAQNTIII